MGVAPDRGAVAGLEDRRFTAFVGREAPLVALVDMLGDAVDGRGHAVAIVGEPGIGKSRLLHEFRRRVADRRLTVLEGRCLPYGASIPYGPLIDILRSNAGIRRRDDPARVRERLAAALEGGLGREPGAAPRPSLTEGRDVPEGLTPEARKARTFEALRLLCLEGRRRPLVLVVEDLHWIDRTSEEFLGMLADDVETSAIMLLTTHRPGYRPPWLSSRARASSRCARWRRTTPSGWSGRRRGARRSPIGWRRRSWTAERATPVPRGAHARRRRGRRGRVGAGDGPRRHRRPYRPAVRPQHAGCSRPRRCWGREFPARLLELVLDDGGPVAPAGWTT